MMNQLPLKQMERHDRQSGLSVLSSLPGLQYSSRLSIPSQQNADFPCARSPTHRRFSVALLMFSLSLSVSLCLSVCVNVSVCPSLSFSDTMSLCLCLSYRHTRTHTHIHLRAHWSCLPLSDPVFQPLPPLLFQFNLLLWHKHSSLTKRSGWPIWGKEIVLKS